MEGINVNPTDLSRLSAAAQALDFYRTRESLKAVAPKWCLETDEDAEWETVCLLTKVLLGRANPFIAPAVTIEAVAVAAMEHHGITTDQFVEVVLRWKQKGGR